MSIIYVKSQCARGGVSTAVRVLFRSTLKVNINMKLTILHIDVRAFMLLLSGYIE